jgi:hypothetical protein
MRRYFYSETGGHPAIDFELELHDDGNFKYTRYEHSYDFGYGWEARGTWEARGAELTLRVGQSDFPREFLPQWSSGSVVIGHVGSSLDLDGVSLSEIAAR